ncbi:M23 family metallopeptidase [Oscillospiraceae bacterium MB08-C2-2]|nr:M23 family metallopeptidase [Oscillospiraceae bacterium MB08-C2-2]
MSSGYRDGRMRSRENRRVKEPAEDTLVAMLTVQLIICLLVVLAASILKRVDGTRYAQIKGQFSVMLSDTGQNQQALEYFRNWPENLQNIREGFDEWLTRKDQPEEEASVSSAAAGPPYNYLNPGGAGGQGGWYPVEVQWDDGGGLSPPAGCTVAPVALTALMKPPVTGVITSPYSYRYHPISGTTDFHNGVDIAAPEGTDILAALPGTVGEVGQSPVYGNYVVINHSETLSTSYSHCSEVLVKEGMVLRQGERVATVGNTGVSTGPHLHFSVLVREVFTDPVWSLEKNIRPVPEQD